MIIYPSELILLFVYASLPAVFVLSIIQTVTFYKNDIFHSSRLKGFFYIVLSTFFTLILSPLLWLLFSHFKLRALAGEVWGSLMPWFPPSRIVGILVFYFITKWAINKHHKLTATSLDGL